MLMKKTLRMLGSLTIAAALATVLGACSSDDSLVDNSAADGTTAARGVTVTVGAGIGDNTDPTPAPPLDGRGVAGAVTRSAEALDASTRSAEALDAVTRSAVVSGTDAQSGKTTRTLTFTTGDRLYVYKKCYNGNEYGYVAGMLTMDGDPTNDGKNATFTGEVKAYYYNGYEMAYNFGADPLDGTTATLVHNGLSAYDYSFFDGDIEFDYSYANDLETLMTNWLKVTGNYAEGGYTLASNEAIINCTVTGLAASKGYQCSLYAEDGSVGSFPFTTDADGNGCIAFSTVYKPGEHNWELKFKEVNNQMVVEEGEDNNYFASISLGHGTLDEGKIYNVSRHWTGTVFSKTIDLATIAHHLLVGSGMTLTGKLATPVKISIANGATVTLAGVTIDEEDSWEYNWAGLTCLGNANIVLNGENTVTTFSDDYPGIQAGPEGTKLTISGSGKLTAKGKNNGAGIGGGILNCGDITISGGTVTASSLSGAGIGSGYIGTCGAITITGCTVTATNNEKGAAIGCGEDGHCGDITIDKGKKNYINVKAETVDEAKPIGLSSHNSQCGKITIGGCNLYEPGDDYYYDIRSLDGFGLKVNDSEDRVWYVKSF